MLVKSNIYVSVRACVTHTAHTYTHIHTHIHTHSIGKASVGRGEAQQLKFKVVEVEYLRYTSVSLRRLTQHSTSKEHTVGSVNMEPTFHFSSFCSSFPVKLETKILYRDQKKKRLSKGRMIREDNIATDAKSA